MLISTGSKLVQLQQFNKKGSVVNHYDGQLEIEIVPWRRHYLAVQYTNTKIDVWVDGHKRISVPHQISGKGKTDRYSLLFGWNPNRHTHIHTIVLILWRPYWIDDDKRKGALQTPFCVSSFRVSLFIFFHHNDTHTHIQGYTLWYWTRARSLLSSKRTRCTGMNCFIKFSILRKVLAIQNPVLTQIVQITRT